MMTTTDSSLPSLCEKLAQQSRCLKDPRRLIAPLLLVLFLVGLIVISVLNVNYLFVGYLIFISALIATGACETFYRSAITCQGSIFACCFRTRDDDESPPSEDENEGGDPQQESITEWANRSLGVTRQGDATSCTSQEHCDRITLVVPTTDANTAPPCYNDVIIHEDPPPSYDDFIGKVDIT